MFIRREQRLLTHERHLLPQSLDLRIDQLATMLRVYMSSTPRAQNFELLFEAALQLIAHRIIRQPIDNPPLLLLKRTFLQIRRRNHLQYRRPCSEQLQMKPRHLSHIALLRIRRAATRQHIDDLPPAPR